MVSKVIIIWQESKLLNLGWVPSYFGLILSGAGQRTPCSTVLCDFIRLNLTWPEHLCTELIFMAHQSLCDYRKHTGTAKVILVEKSKWLSNFKHKTALLHQMPAESHQNIALSFLDMYMSYFPLKLISSLSSGLSFEEDTISKTIPSIL